MTIIIFAVVNIIILGVMTAYGVWVEKNVPDYDEKDFENFDKRA